MFSSSFMVYFLSVIHCKQYAAGCLSHLTRVSMMEF